MANSTAFSHFPGNTSFSSSLNPSNVRVLRVLGIDPGLASTGWGVVDFANNRYRMVNYGVIETTPEMTHGERLCAIYNRPRRLERLPEPELLLRRARRVLPDLLQPQRPR